MIKRTKIMMLVFSMILASDLFAQSVQTGKKILEPESSWFKNHEQDTDFDLIPDCEYKNQILNDRVAKTNVPFVGEQLYVVRKNGNFDIKEAARIFTSVSEMKGMEYYSTTRKKYAELYKTAGFVKSLEEPEFVNDYKLSECDRKTFYALLDDKSFGKNIYRLDYRQNENTLFVRLSNADPMGIGSIKAVRPYNMVMNILLVDEGDQLEIYLGTDVNMKKIPGMKKQISDSLVSRMDAIYKWLLEKF